MTRKISIGGAEVGAGGPLLVIAGPCVIEDKTVTMQTAEGLKDICQRLGMPLVFKSSFDKANRTSIKAYRGPGMADGLAALAEVKQQIGLPVISDIHMPEQAAPAAEVLDAIQIPAFLCRQTDLLLAAAATGKPVNVKKGQFLAPWDMKNVIDKFITSGNENLLLTERGTMFGYNNLVVDYRSLPLMRAYGYPVVFDLTHSLQLPGGRGTSTGGQREYAPILLRAAAAAGMDAVFMEVHPNPEQALCDGANMIALDKVENLLRSARDIHAMVAGV